MLIILYIHLSTGIFLATAYLTHSAVPPGINLLFVQASNDKSLEKEFLFDLNHNKIQIIIPSGLISGPKMVKYGSYAEVSVPLENTFGKMTVSDDLVERNGRVTTLSLLDRDRNVSVYDKEQHSYDVVAYSVADLK